MHEPLRLRKAADSGASSVQHVLHRDYETRSRLSLKFLGTPQIRRRSQHRNPSVAYAVDDGPVQLWLPDDPVPPEFIEAANNPIWVVAAHDDHFETAD